MPARAVGHEDAWRLSPAGFARRVTGHIWPAHLRLLSQVLVLVATGRIKRLTVSLPPGHAKSTAVMRVFPAWTFDLWPERKLIGASYGGSLVIDHSRAARDMIVANQRLLRVRLREEGNYADDWQTTAGGGYRTAGIGGSITGRRANGALADDLHKGYDDAHSASSREHVWNFMTGDLRTRLLPSAFMCVVGTRWHEEDIIGRLINADEGKTWTVLRLPAIAEGDEEIRDVLSADTCDRLESQGVTLPKWSRGAGEPLWPTNVDPETGTLEPWYDLTELASIRQDLGEYKWAALYQARPSPPGGEMFPASMWDRSDVVPPKTPMVRFWDLAATEGGGDETAGALLTRDEQGYTYVVDVVHGRWSDSQVEQVLKNTAMSDAEKYGRRVKVVMEQEGGSGGKAWSRRIIREVLAGYSVEAESPSGDKPTRARPLAAQQQAGMVKLVRRIGVEGSFVPAPWFDPLVEQMAVFPNGKHDDMVDACSGAFNRLVGHGSRRVKTTSVAGRRVGG